MAADSSKQQSPLLAPKKRPAKGYSSVTLTESAITKSSTSSLRNVVWPSRYDALTPPGCKLRGAADIYPLIPGGSERSAHGIPAASASPENCEHFSSVSLFGPWQLGR